MEGRGRAQLTGIRCGWWAARSTWMEQTRPSANVTWWSWVWRLVVSESHWRTGPALVPAPEQYKEHNHTNAFNNQPTNQNLPSLISVIISPFLPAFTMTRNKRTTQQWMHLRVFDWTFDWPRTTTQRYLLLSLLLLCGFLVNYQLDNNNNDDCQECAYPIISDDSNSGGGHDSLWRPTNLVGWNGQPVVVHGGLLFESAVKDFLHVVKAESANSRAGQGVGRCCKCGVDYVHSLAFVSTFIRASCRFCLGSSGRHFVLFFNKRKQPKEQTLLIQLNRLTNFVEIKRIIPRNGTIESRFEKGGPAVTELVRSASIRFANTGDSWIDRLQSRLLFSKKFEFHNAVDVFLFILLFLPCRSSCIRRPFPGKWNRRSHRERTSWQSWELGKKKRKKPRLSMLSGHKIKIWIKHEARGAIIAWQTTFSTTGCNGPPSFIISTFSFSLPQVVTCLIVPSTSRQPENRRGRKKKRINIEHYIYRSSWLRRTVLYVTVPGKWADPFRRNRPLFRQRVRHLQEKKVQSKNGTTSQNKRVNNKTAWINLPTKTDVLLCEGS